jgi:integrating conjugative element protein (TIGR03759 family)
MSAFRSHSLLSIAILVSVAVPCAAQDSDSSSSRIESSRVQAAQDTAAEARLAGEWGLKAEEWARYRELMRGPLGIYSPNLDPLTALGIEARSDEERRHFARLQVQAEGRRAEKTLAYQRAYDEAWRDLYPGLRRVAETAEPATAATSQRAMTSEAPGRMAVFVKDNCPSCDERVRQLQSAGESFDVYVVGSERDDERIRRWAARAGIDPAAVKAKRITLNHDAGRWLSVGGTGALPAVLTEVDGQWRRD